MLLVLLMGVVLMEMVAVGGGGYCCGRIAFTIEGVVLL